MCDNSRVRNTTLPNGARCWPGRHWFTVCGLTAQNSAIIGTVTPASPKPSKTVNAGTGSGLVVGPGSLADAFFAVIAVLPVVALFRLLSLIPL